MCPPFLLLCFESCIFFSGCDASANMSFRFILIQNCFYLCINIGVDFFQPVRYVFMYGAFAYMKFLCGGANGRIMLNDVMCERYGTFLRQSFQDKASPAILSIHLYAGKMVKRTCCPADENTKRKNFKICGYPFALDDFGAVDLSQTSIYILYIYGIMRKSLRIKLPIY